MTNPVLENIRERRSIKKFSKYELSDTEINTILDAGRWAPSDANRQPWRFIVIRDPETKQELVSRAKKATIFNLEIADASAVIAVCVNAEEDPDHFVEDGAVATQNMALAAHSLGLASYWVGVFQIKNGKGSVENELKELLDIPDEYRLISLLPIGKAEAGKQPARKGLRELVFYEKFDDNAQNGRKAKSRRGG